MDEDTFDDFSHQSKVKPIVGLTISIVVVSTIFLIYQPNFNPSTFIRYTENISFSSNSPTSFLPTDLVDILPKKDSELSKHTIPKTLVNAVVNEDYCSEMLQNQQLAAEIGKKRYGAKDNQSEIPMNCKAIRERGSYYEKPLTSDEANFPIAFARIVFADYHFQEMLFDVMFAPQNYYCYIFDNKASELFHKQMKLLGRCFKNIIISEEEYAVDSAGHNMIRSFLHCMRLLLQYPDWKYVVLLQNHDVPLKTNYELVQILKALNNTNDVEMKHPNQERIPPNLQWTFDSLQLFRDPSLNDNRIFRFAKGACQGSFTRLFVEFLLKKLDVSTLLNRLERMPFGIDELFFSSLNMEDNLEAPGGFTRKCLTEEPVHITRFSIWYDTKSCGSKELRHSICLFGVEDLRTLDSVNSIFANKFYPEFDFAAVSCWTQHLYKLTYGLVNRTLNLEYYRKMPHVRFNSDIVNNKKNLNNFKCKT